MGCLCRIGLLLERKKKLSFANFFFTFVFSISSGIIMFFYSIEKGYSTYMSVVTISLASFFGSELIPGLGTINSKFFADTFKEFIRKWVNKGNKNSDFDD